MKYPARLAMQDGNEETPEGFRRRNLMNSNVRRRLFVDDESEVERSENRQGLSDNRTNEFFENARDNGEKAKARWNFDFKREIPLPGNYHWVKLDKDGKEVGCPVLERERQVDDRVRSTRETNDPEDRENRERLENND